MRIFLSYASQDREAAESVSLALAANGHDVFFDRDDLPPGEEFHGRIREAIQRTHLFVFLLSPDAVDAGSYTLNELDFAKKRWAHPSGRILPVLLRPTGLDLVPPWLLSVTLFEPHGNIAAAVAHEIEDIARTRRRSIVKAAGIAVAVVATLSTGLWWLAANREPPRTVNGRDGAPGVLVPGGVFTMGDDVNTPVRELFIDSFYIDTYEVTTARYARFLEASGSMKPPDYWDQAQGEDTRDMPVVGVDWHDADAYCQWAGRRLPTEGEWEKAARGTDQRMWPWGTGEPDSTRARFDAPITEPYSGAGVMPVGHYEAGQSPFGAHDLAGNVSEWVADWYEDSFLIADVRNPKGPPTGPGKVLRSGGWYDAADRLMTTRRFFAGQDFRSDDLGFRCARDFRE